MDPHTAAVLYIGTCIVIIVACLCLLVVLPVCLTIKARRERHDDDDLG